MKDSKSLLDHDATEFERHWLSAARTEEPPPELVARIERALGLGPAGSASPPPRTGTTASVAKRGLSALQIGTLSVLGIGGAIGLALLLTRPAPPPPGPVRPPASETIASSAPPPAPPSRPAA